MNEQNNRVPKVSVMRVVEAIIIAAIVGAVSLYGGSISMKSEIKHIEQSLTDVKTQLCTLSAKVDSAAILNAIQSTQIDNLSVQITEANKKRAKEIRSIVKEVEVLNEKVK